MNILLFGSTGFIGKHLLRHLKAAGHDVTTPTRYHAISTIPGRFDAVIDLAWNGVPARFRNDFALQSGNVARFGNLLANLPRWNPKVVLGFGSQAEYGRFANRAVYAGIANTTQPLCAYGAAKQACRQMLEVAADQMAFRFGWLRLFSVYGPGESADWLIPATIKKMRSGAPLEFTAGEQWMDYLHVSDVCRAVLACLERETFWGCHDLASGHPVQLRDLLKQLGEIEPQTQPIQLGALPYRPNQVMCMCGEKTLWRTLGIEPQITLRDGLMGVSESIP